MPVDAFPTMPEGRMRRRAVGNLLHMGHCAPSVMQTLLDASDTDDRWPVLLTAGLPGGIGNTGAECGGLTAPLVLMGLRHGRREADGLPVVVDAGHDLLQRFQARCGTTRCRDILRDARVPLRCIGVVREAPAMCARCLAASDHHAVPPQARAAYRDLYRHWLARDFHCADAVLDRLDATVDDDDLTDAVSAFLGGTVFSGMTCGALVAGVMALGLAFGDVEDSLSRVARMLGTMAVRGDAMADDINRFNHAVNLGHELAAWFRTEFGSTRCHALTGCDFATADGVRDYLDRDGTAACREIAQRVAGRVTETIAAS